MGIVNIVNAVFMVIGLALLCAASFATFKIESAWGSVVRYALMALSCFLVALAPGLAQAHIVTCREAGAVMADYAADRDRGVSLTAALRDLSYANKGGSVSQIQMRRLRYDLRGIYEDYALSHASPAEIQGLYRQQCPSEFVP